MLGTRPGAVVAGERYHGGGIQGVLRQQACDPDWTGVTGMTGVTGAADRSFSFSAIHGRPGRRAHDWSAPAGLVM
jgi:hypothetical protein